MADNPLSLQGVFTPELIFESLSMIFSWDLIKAIWLPLVILIALKFGGEYLVDHIKRKKKGGTSSQNYSLFEKQTKVPEEKFAYKSRVYLMSKAELSFYKKLLVEYPKDQYFVFSKVRLADLIDPEGFGEKRLFAFNKIKAKHIDFVVTDHQSKILKAIELDDYTHNGEKRKERDSFVNEVLQGAGIEIVRV